MSEHKSGAVGRAFHIAVVERMGKEIATLKARHDELLAALRKYGDHLPDCALEINHPMINRCTCGYHEAITNAENDKP